MRVKLIIPLTLILSLKGRGSEESKIIIVIQGLN
jgi:hypothetical protein